MGTQLRLKSLCVPANGPSCTGRSWRQARREQVRPLTRSDCLAPILKYFSYRFLLKSSAYIYKCVYICEYPFSSRTLFSACSLLKAVNTPFDSVCGMQKRLLRENCHIPTLLKYLVSESPMVLYTSFLKWCFAINRNMAKDWKAHVLRSFHSSVAGLAGKNLFWQSFGAVHHGVIPSAGYHLKNPFPGYWEVAIRRKSGRDKNLLGRKRIQMETGPRNSFP